MNSFGGMKKLWIFLGDNYIIGLIWGLGREYIYTFFLRQGTEWEIFFAVTKFQIFILECLIFLLGKQ